MAIEDWTDYGDSADDFDAGDWESICGGPSDESDVDYAYRPDEYEKDKVDSEYSIEEFDRDVRCEMIFDWLRRSYLAQSVEGVNGFCVKEGVNVQLMGGEIVDATRWLRDEGFLNRNYVCGHLIRYFWDRNPHKLTVFFEQTFIKAPFERTDMALVPEKDGYVKSRSSNSLLFDDSDC